MILNCEFTPNSNPVKICQVLMTTDPSLPYGIPPAGYRLPAETRLGAVRLQVSNLDRSAAYYREVLGLREIARDESKVSLAPVRDSSTAHSAGDRLTERDALTNTLGADAPLVVLHHVPGTRAIAPRARLGLFHFAILLPDRASLARFVTHLAENGIRAGASDHLVSEALYLTDPDGLGIEIYADRPRSEWRHHARQLAMASEPLDFRALAATAGNTKWTGMPTGTVMGHVHLHVGDLDRAAAFYHDGLGLDKVVWNYPGALFLSAGGYHHHLGLNTWAADAPPPGPLDAQLLEWEMILPSARDVGAARESVEGAGFAAEPPEPMEPAEPAEGAARIRDPWGTTIRLRT
jgi:catechol 2,3-dioxygenase